MLRFVFRLVGLLFILLIVLVGGIFLLSGERLARLASDQITATLGREVVISDELRPQLFPALGVRTGAFSVAGTRGDAPLATGEGLSVGVDLLGLLSRRVDVKDVTLIAPRLTLIKYADGQTNWSTETEAGRAESAGAGGASAPQRELSLAGLSVQDGTIHYQDAAAGLDLLFEAIDLTASMPSADGPLTASFALVTNGQAASGDVELAALAPLLAGESTDVSIAAQIGKNSVSFLGFVATSGAVTGEFDVSLPTPDTLLALTGGGSAALPTEVLPIEAKGSVDATAENVAVSGSYGFGTNRLQGPLSVALGDVPFLSAQLAGGDLDLSFLSAEEGSATNDAPAAEGKGWSTDPIDASGLGLLDADIRLEATSIDLGTTAMQNVVAAVTIDNARAVARILQAEAFGGALVGQFVANNRNGLSVAGEMGGKTVAIQSLLTDVAGFDRMRGAGNTQLSFLGVGQSIDQIMRSLSGNGALDIGQGDITGFDLASLFGGSGAADAVGERATTIFQSLSASFTIENGVMRNDDLLISANLFEARGRGDVDLGAQRLDYTIRPEVFENDLTGGLTIPVRIEGPWANLRIYPDLEAVARERLKVEEEKIRAEAEARLEAERQKAEDRANARLEKERQKLENKLENELRKGLGNLFD